MTRRWGQGRELRGARVVTARAPHSDDTEGMGGCTELGTSSTMVTGRQWLGTACLCGCMGQQGAAGSGFERWLQALDTMLVPAASRSHDHFGHENWDHQLKLAVAWNRVDMARSEIFTDERQWKVRLLGAALGRGAWRHPPPPPPVSGAMDARRASVWAQPSPGWRREARACVLLPQLEPHLPVPVPGEHRRR